ncbi:hypothetical protein SDC9_179943 [bioreactor metagenome]|uniref:Uncharacterized protein n=1 Tax=bioreactor metagenome TaxID=1076179 RepID=A0A645H097_9ZZZZ
MRFFDRFKHNLFFDLVRTGFDHVDLLRGSSHGEGKIGCLPLFAVRIDDDLTVHQAHMHTADRAEKGYIGYGNCNGSADHGRDLRRIVLFHR